MVGEGAAQTLRGYCVRRHDEDKGFSSSWLLIVFGLLGRALLSWR
jgi:hypothetical protein